MMVVMVVVIVMTMAQVGTNKSNILEARIWVKDIKRDFAAMNGVRAAGPLKWAQQIKAHYIIIFFFKVKT